MTLFRNLAIRASLKSSTFAQEARALQLISLQYLRDESSQVAASPSNRISIALKKSVGESIGLSAQRILYTKWASHLAAGLDPSYFPHIVQSGSFKPSIMTKLGQCVDASARCAISCGLATQVDRLPRESSIMWARFSEPFQKPVDNARTKQGR